VNTLWLKYDNWMKGQYSRRKAGLSVVTVNEGTAQIVRIAACGSSYGDHM